MQSELVNVARGVAEHATTYNGPLIVTERMPAYELKTPQLRRRVDATSIQYVSG
jgi:hypothetical protein